jgi:hypothetical protein
VELVDISEDAPRDLVEASSFPYILSRYWRAIRTCHVVGAQVQDRYNYRWSEDVAWTDWYPRFTRDVFRAQTTQMKINASFGYVLRHKVTEDERYYHSCQNNTRILDRPQHVSDLQSFHQFLENIQQVDVLEWARQQRPDSNWVVDAVTNITFFVNKIKGHPMGFSEDLPNYLRYNKGLLSLHSMGDNLCLFRCLATHQIYQESKDTDVRWNKIRRSEKNVKVLFQLYCSLYELPFHEHNFPGVELSDLHLFEACFEINVNIFTIQTTGETEKVAGDCEMIRRSLLIHQDTMNLNLYKNHLGYIKDMHLYSNSYMCTSCQKMWKSAWTLKRHMQTCNEKVKTIYKGGVYALPQTIFQKLEGVNVIVPLQERVYPYFITYDTEAYLSKDVPETTSSIHWQSRHIPLSISVCSNMPGFTEPVCFINRGEPEGMVRAWMCTMLCIAYTANNLLKERFCSQLDKLQTLSGEENTRNQKRSEQEEEEEEEEY